MIFSEADILIGGLDRDQRVQKLLWITIPYIQDDQTWCVAKAKPQDVWRNIFGLYTISTWLALIASIIFIGVVIHLFLSWDQRVEHIVWTLMLGLASTIGQYVCYEPNRLSVRILLIFMFMYGMVMSTSFNSFLIGILTRPRFKAQIDSMEDAIEAKMNFTGGEVALSHFAGDRAVRTSNLIRAKTIANVKEYSLNFRFQK